MNRIVSILLMILVARGSFGQMAKVGYTAMTVADLEARDPVPYERVEVINVTTNAPWESSRFFAHDPFSSAIPSYGYVHTNHANSGRYIAVGAAPRDVSIERTAPGTITIRTNIIVDGTITLETASEPNTPTNAASYWLSSAATKEIAIKWPDASVSKFWHNGNHGAGSGLDADLLDGRDGSWYLATSNHTGNLTPSWVNVLDYGAVIGSTNDATPSFQAAINSGSAVVYIPKGGFDFRSTLMVTNTVRLVGDHKDRTTIRYFGTNYAIQVGGGTNFITRGASLENLFVIGWADPPFDGSYAPSNALGMVHVYGAVRGSLKNLRVSNAATGNGLLFDRRAWYWDVDNFAAFDCGVGMNFQCENPGVGDLVNTITAKGGNISGCDIGVLTGVTNAPSGTAERGIATLKFDNIGIESNRRIGMWLNQVEVVDVSTYWEGNGRSTSIGSGNQVRLGNSLDTNSWSVSGVKFRANRFASTTNSVEILSAENVSFDGNDHQDVKGAGVQYVFGTTNFAKVHIGPNEKARQNYFNNYYPTVQWMDGYESSVTEYATAPVRGAYRRENSSAVFGDGTGSALVAARIHDAERFLVVNSTNGPVEVSAHLIGQTGFPSVFMRTDGTEGVFGGRYDSGTMPLALEMNTTRYLTLDIAQSVHPNRFVIGETNGYDKLTVYGNGLFGDPTVYSGYTDLDSRVSVVSTNMAEQIGLFLFGADGVNNRRSYLKLDLTVPELAIGSSYSNGGEIPTIIRSSLTGSNIATFVDSGMTIRNGAGITFGGVVRTNWPTDAETLDGQDGTWYLARANHTGTQDWSTITGTPTTLFGYGITDPVWAPNRLVVGSATGHDKLTVHGNVMLGSPTNYGGFSVFDKQLSIISKDQAESLGLVLYSYDGTTNRSLRFGLDPFNTEAVLQMGYSVGGQFPFKIRSAFGNDIATFNDSGLTIRAGAELVVNGKSVTNFEGDHLSVSGGKLNVADGAGSGLDSDLLDAQHGAYYLARSNHVGLIPWSQITNTPTTLAGYGITDPVWTSTNDGAGSGLDADLLDAQHGAYYLARANHTGTQNWSTITGTPTTTTGYGIAPTSDGNFYGQLNANWVALSSNHVGGLSAWMALKAAVSHTHDAGDVTTGTFIGERVGKGTPTTNTFLQGGGAGASPFWGTIPSTPSPTNGITDAPADGYFYGRRNNSWTTPDISDVGGTSYFVSNFLSTVTTATDARTQLELIGGSVATIDSPAQYVVRVNSGGSTSTRHRLNLIAGSGISLSLSDDGANDESDTTIRLADGDYGDVSIGSSGSALTVDDAAVTYAKIQDVSAASRLLGRGSSSGSGDVQELTLGGGLAMTGTVLHTNPVTVASSKLVGRGSASSGPAEEITLGTGLSMSGTTLSATASGDTAAFAVAAFTAVDDDGDGVPVPQTLDGANSSGVVSISRVTDTGIYLVVLSASQSSSPYKRVEICTIATAEEVFRASVVNINPDQLSTGTSIYIFNQNGNIADGQQAMFRIYSH